MCVCLLVSVFHFCLSPRDKQFVCLRRTTIFTHRRGIHFYIEMLVIMMVLMVFYDVVSRAKTLESRASKLFAGTRIDRGRALKVSLNKKLLVFFVRKYIIFADIAETFLYLILVGLWGIILWNYDPRVQYMFWLGMAVIQHILCYYCAKGRCQKHPQGGSLVFRAGINPIHYF